MKLDLETSDSFEGWNPIVQQPHVYIFSIHVRLLSLIPTLLSTLIELSCYAIIQRNQPTLSSLIPTALKTTGYFIRGEKRFL